MKKNNLASWVFLNGPTLLFLTGLLLINVAVYFIVRWPTALMINGGTLVLISLIMVYEQNKLERR